jgi:hypothetical protein
MFTYVAAGFFDLLNSMFRVSCSTILQLANKRPFKKLGKLRSLS